MARKAGITPGQVLDAATVVADRDGLAAVSLATVATALGVRAPSLYAHVDGLEGLRRDLAHRANRLLTERLRSAEPVAVVAGVLADLGITPDRHIDLVRTLRALLHGFVDLENGGGFGLADPVDGSFEAALDLVLGALAGSRDVGASAGAL